MLPGRALTAQQPSRALEQQAWRCQVKEEEHSPPLTGVSLESKCSWAAFKAPTASLPGLDPADNLFKRLNGSLMAGIHFNL